MCTYITMFLTCGTRGTTRCASTCRCGRLSEGARATEDRHQAWPDEGEDEVPPKATTYLPTYLTSPHLTSPHLTSPHLTSPTYP